MKQHIETYKGWELNRVYSDTAGWHTLLYLEAEKGSATVMHCGESVDCLKRKVREAQLVREINGEAYSQAADIVDSNGKFSVDANGVHCGYVPWGAGGFEAYGNSKEEVATMLTEQIESEL